MSFTYDAGSSSPTYAGLAEIGGVRINNGTFISEHLAGIIDSPAPRTTVSDLPSDNGAFIGPQYYGPRDIEIAGRIKVASPDDVPSARDHLKAALALIDPATSWPLVCDMRGWTARRQCVVRLNGAVTFEEPETTRRKGTTRDFTIPLVAADPVLYDADNVQSVTLPMDASHVTLTGAGSMPVPFTARFTGPWTSGASLIRNSDGLMIALTMSLSAGQYVDVDVTPPAPSAIRSTGDNDFGALTSLSLRSLAPGVNSWRADATSGTTGASQVTVSWRDGWI